LLFLRPPENIPSLSSFSRCPSFLSIGTVDTLFFRLQAGFVRGTEPLTRTIAGTGFLLKNFFFPLTLFLFFRVFLEPFPLLAEKDWMQIAHMTMLKLPSFLPDDVL